MMIIMIMTGDAKLNGSESRSHIENENSLTKATLENMEYPAKYISIATCPDVELNQLT